MSRIGRHPVTVPAGVNVEINGQHVKVTGKLGTLELDVNSAIAVKLEGSEIALTRSSETKEVKSLHGLSRALVANMVKGVTEGFTRKLTVNGVGIKGSKQGNKLVLNIGYSHPVEFVEEPGINLEYTPANEIIVSGISKEKVGAMAAKIRAAKPVEPYHLYGIKYAEEVVIKKQGKTAAAGKK